MRIRFRIQLSLWCVSGCGSGLLFDPDPDKVPGYQNDADPYPKHWLSWPFPFVMCSEVLRSCELTEAEVRTRFESLAPLMNHCGDAVHNRLLRAGLIAEVTIQVGYNWPGSHSVLIRIRLIKLMRINVSGSTTLGLTSLLIQCCIYTMKQKKSSEKEKKKMHFWIRMLFQEGWRLLFFWCWNFFNGTAEE
jgi:hypothetical protein